jgi:hypothetical protein
MLAKQYEVWNSYPEHLKQRINFVVVDDASPEPAEAVPRPKGLDLQLYRVLEDIPWHQDGARNLGAWASKYEWIFFCDMDHVVPDDQVHKMFNMNDAFALYRFYRRHSDDRKPLTPAINIFACTKNLFMTVGGYDERLCGAYGSDRYFRDRALNVASEYKFSDVLLDVYMPDQIEDCRTEGLERTGPENKAKLEKALKESEGIRPLFMYFRWERII